MSLGDQRFQDAPTHAAPMQPLRRPGLLGFILLVLANVLMLIEATWATVTGYAVGIGGLVLIGVAFKRRLDRQVQRAPAE